MSIDTKSIEQREFWKSHSAAWKTSNLTQQKYCETQGINYPSFVYQHARLARQAKVTNINFVEAKAGSVNTNQNSGLQLMLPNGVRVGVTNEVNINLLQTILTLVGEL